MKGKMIKRITAAALALAMSVGVPFTPFHGILDEMSITAYAEDVALSVDEEIPDGTAGHYYYNMPGYTQGKTVHNTLTISEQDITGGAATFKVYDNGGKGGNYGYSIRAYLTITAPTGKVVKVNGSVTTYNDSDFLYIYDGTDNNASQFFNGSSEKFSGNATVDVLSSSNSVTLYFQTDGTSGSIASGLDLTVEINDTTAYATDISRANVTGMKSLYNYTGSAISLDYSVTAYGSSTTLTKGIDYTETITKDGMQVSDAIEEGNYTLTITGNSPYYGSQSFDFEVWDETGTLSIDNSFNEGEAGYYYINMPGAGTRTKNLDLSDKSDGFTFNIYDDGGKGEWKTGTYWKETSTGATEGSCGYIKITAPEGFVIQLTGKVMTTNYYAYLTVYNGDNTNCQTLCTNVYGIDKSRSEAIVDIGTLMSTGNTMLVYFQNEWSWACEGLWLTATLKSTNTTESISYADYSNGTVTAYVNSEAVTAAEAGTEVTLSIAPDDGYIINYITVKDGNNNTIPVTGGWWYDSSTSATFTMPASAVTVTPVFIATNNMTASNGLRYDASSNVKSINMGNNIHSFYIYADTQIDLTVSADDCNKLKFDGSVGTNSTHDALRIYDGSNRSATLLFEQNYIHHNISEKSTGTSMYFISSANASATYLFTGTIAQIYAISYDLAGGTVADANPSEYTCETDTFTLTNPTREGYEFAGWTGTELDAASTSVTIAKGSYGNRSYTATWKKLLTNSDITVETIADQTYTGSIITPNITVKDGETDITDQCDIAITNNTNVGTADVTITAKATSSEYSGSTSTTFKIVYADGIGAQLAGYSLSLDGDIGVNFYMELSPEVVADDGAYMHFELPNGKTSDVSIRNTELKTVKINGTDKTYYVFKCKVSATEMTETIYAQMFSNGTGGKIYDYSVKKYAETLLASPGNYSDKPDKASALVSAMLTYGAYSQTYFNYKTESPATENTVDVSSVTESMLSKYATYEEANLPRDDTGAIIVDLAGANLDLESETVINLYFTSSTDKELTFKTDSDVVLNQRKSGNYTIVKITDIPAQDNGKPIKVKIYIDDAYSGYVEYCPFHYCYNVLSRETTATRTDELKDCIRAFVLYSNTAYDYAYGGDQT